MKVGFLGLGGMGAAMATRLVQAGLEVTLWNRSAAACEPLVALGATRAEEVGELFGLDVVISMLADDQAIRAVLLDSGALERARPGLIHLSMSTLSLDCVEALDQAHQRQGIAFVAAPVFLPHRRGRGRQAEHRRRRSGGSHRASQGTAGNYGTEDMVFRKRPAQRNGGEDLW